MILYLIPTLTCVCCIAEVTVRGGDAVRKGQVLIIKVHRDTAALGRVGAWPGSRT